MKKLITTLALSLSFIPSFAHSAASVQDLTNCPLQNQSDKYENPAKISGGSMFYADQCIDTNRFRHPVMIDSADSIKFANYHHSIKPKQDPLTARYYIAEI
jgi:hypothetical protein